MKIITQIFGLYTEKQVNQLLDIYEFDKEESVKLQSLVIEQAAIIAKLKTENSNLSEQVNCHCKWQNNTAITPAHVPLTEKQSHAQNVQVATPATEEFPELTICKKCRKVFKNSHALRGHKAHCR